MSQRVKRPNRSDDGSVPVKRRKRPTAEEEETASLAWQPRLHNDLKSIYNRTTTEAPAELFRKDLISAMKLPDSEPLANDEYWVIVDQWKQEWERGVQVPVNPDSLPEPSVTVTHCGTLVKPQQEFRLPKNKYIRITKDDNFKIDEHVLSSAPAQAEAACSYDLDECDVAWLKVLNGERAASGLSPLNEDQLERILERLELRCWDKIQSILRNEEGLGIEYDENVICDVCRSPDSEEGNEMVFCDSCNICVHQACYGITRIPDGQWLCCTCALSQRPDCVLCPNKGGAMKCTRSGQKWAHVSCALWIPEVSIGCVEKMEPITKISSIPQSRWALICVLCRERVGACIQCSVKTCKTAYHVTCAFKHGLEMRAIIEDENADDGVKLRSYCEKHSKSSKKEKSVCSGSEDDDCKRKKRKDMTSEEKNQARAQRLQEIEAEFYKHVNVKDISLPIDVDPEALQYVYNYWKLKRKAAHNKPLLPPKADDVDVLSHKQEQADLEKMKMFVQLRQDLERVRNLCYMVSRREKLSRTFFRMREQTFYKQASVLNASNSLPTPVVQAVIQANHGPSIYDRLYSFNEAEDHTDDFDSLLACIAGDKDRKTEINGLFKDVKNSPYEKHYFNGSKKREMFYGSGLSSSSADEQPKENKENRLHTSSESDKKKMTRKNSKATERKKRLDRQKESSSEDERPQIKSRLKQMEKEYSLSGSDTDDLLPIKTTSTNLSDVKMSAIYSDSDSSDTSMKEVSDSQQNRLRTKAAVKEFSQKPSTSKTKSPNKKKKERKEPSKKSDYVPSDLIVPQRQAAKIASENLKSTTSRSKETTQTPPDDTKTVEKKPKMKKVKPQPKEKEKKESTLEKENGDKLEQDLFPYVPQRQAAIKAAEHIKSGLGKPVTTEQANETSDNKGKLDVLKTKKDEPKPIEMKRKSSSSSSSSGSSSDSSSSSTTDSEEEIKSQSENKRPNAKDWPFLDKEPKSAASSASSDSSDLPTTPKSFVPKLQQNRKDKKPLEREEPPRGRGRPRGRPKLSTNSSDRLRDVSSRSGNITDTDMEGDLNKKETVKSNKLLSPIRKEDKRLTNRIDNEVSNLEKEILERKAGREGYNCNNKVRSTFDRLFGSPDKKKKVVSKEKKTPEKVNKVKPAAKVSDNKFDKNDKLLSKTKPIKSPKVERPKSPKIERSKSPKDESNSPKFERAKSPKGRSKSPKFDRSKSPKFERTKSPKGRSKSPKPERTKSPKFDRAKSPKDRSKSPKFDRTKSPKFERAKSPKIERSKSPKIDNRRSKSPFERLKSPVYDRTKSPKIEIDKKSTKFDRSKSPKPEERRVERSRSPKLERLKSPKFDNSRSPMEVERKSRLDKAKSPKVDRLISPKIERCKSPKDRSKSPVVHRTQSPQKVERNKSPKHDKNKSSPKIDKPLNKLDKSLTKNERLPCKVARSRSPKRDRSKSPIYLPNSSPNNKTPPRKNKEETTKKNKRIDDIFADKLHNFQETAVKKSQESNQAFSLIDHQNNQKEPEAIKNDLKERHLSNRSIFSPQPPPKDDLLDIDNIFEDGFGMSKDDEIMKGPLTFSFAHELAKEDTKEDRKETLDLVKKLRMGLSKKSTTYDVEETKDSYGTEQIVPNEIAEEKLLEPPPPQVNLNVRVELSDIMKGKEAYNYDSGLYVEQRCSAANTSTNANNSTNTYTNACMNTNLNASVNIGMNANINVSTNACTNSNTNVSASANTNASANEDVRWEQQQQQQEQQESYSSNQYLPFPEEPKKLQLFKDVLKKTPPPILHERQPFIDQSSMDVASSSPYGDLPPHKWNESQLMVTRRSSSSSAISQSSNGSRRNEEDELLKKQEVMLMNQATLEMTFGVLPPYAPSIETFPQFSEPSPFVNPVSLFPPPNINTQLSFPSPGTALFPPAFGTPFPGPHAVMPPLPKPVDDTIHYPTACTAAFTSSQHNMALTAAMVNLPPKEPQQEEQPQPPQEVPIESPAPSNNSTTPNHVEPPKGKKSPSKPTRTSARVMSNMNKSPSKSPGKSPRQESSKVNVSRSRTDTKRSSKLTSSRTNQLQARNRGRGRGRKFSQQNEYTNTIHNNLVGTVYDLDFDEDISNDNMADLRALRERRKSVDLHERKESLQSPSPKFASPKTRTFNADLSELRPPTPIDTLKAETESEPEQITPVKTFPDIVQPVLPGPVDMRTYSNNYEAPYNDTNLLGAFGSGAPEQVHDDIDEELEKEFQNNLTASLKKTEEPPAAQNIKVSLSDSRNQLKVKIKGPIANYTASVQPLPPVIDNTSSILNATSNNAMNNNANANPTTNLRRMRKKELLRQYVSQDMNMDEGPMQSGTSTPAAPPISRTIITIPKAVASMTTIPTKDDYRDYRFGVDEHRKETKARPLSRELKHLEIPLDDERRSLGGADSALKRRGRPPRPQTTPKLKIKIGNSIVGTKIDDKKDRIRPPKKRLSTIAMPSVEDLKRESMKFRKRVMADFDEEKRKKKDKSEKRKKKKRKQEMQIIANESTNPTKLIIRFGKKENDAERTETDCLTIIGDVDDKDEKEDNGLLKTKITPIKLKISRCQEGSGYVMKTDDEPSAQTSQQPPPNASDVTVTATDTSKNHSTINTIIETIAVKEKSTSIAAPSTAAPPSTSSSSTTTSSTTDPVLPLNITTEIAHTPKPLPLNKDCEVR